MPKKVRLLTKPTLLFYLFRLIARGLFHSIAKVRIDGVENIPVNQQYILISNHLNWSDPFFLYTIFPPTPRLVFVAEFQGIYDSPAKRKFIDLMGKPIVPLDRDDAASRISALKAMYKVVREGDILSIFPEGRLGHREGDLFPLHVGIFSVSRKLQVPILPVAIAGTKDLAWHKPVHIRIGNPEACAPDESDEDFARRIALKLRELLPPYPGDGPNPRRMNWLAGLCQGELRPFEGDQDLIIPTGREKRDKDSQ